MKNRFVSLFLSLMMACTLCAKKNMKIFTPNIFGGEYQYLRLDSMKQSATFLPSVLYALQKDGKHVGFAIYVIGYTDYSAYTANTTYINQESGNGAIYFLGSTKEGAIATLRSLEEITQTKKAGNSLNGNAFKMISKNGKIFYEEHYSKLVGHDETLFRIRYSTVGGLGAVKGVFISSTELEPAFLSLKQIRHFIQDIEAFPEPNEMASWENEQGNGEVRFSSPIYAVYLGSCAWVGFGGSEMYLFRREYIPDEKDADIFPADLDGFRPHWKYTIEDPSTMQGALLQLGSNIDQAIQTVDEMIAGMANLQKFFKENKIWMLWRSNMPEGYIYFDDIPREHALDNTIYIKMESSRPELMWTYNLDADTKGLSTSTTVLKNIRKMLVKEKASK